MARRGKLKKTEVIIFELNLESELLELVEQIKHGKYKTGNYRTFKIYEPKERDIQALPYRDRVVCSFLNANFFILQFIWIM